MYEACPGPSFGQLTSIFWDNETRTYIFIGCNAKEERIWERYNPEEHAQLVSKPSDLTLKDLLEL